MRRGVCKRTDGVSGRLARQRCRVYSSPLLGNDSSAYSERSMKVPGALTRLVYWFCRTPDFKSIKPCHESDVNRQK